MMKKKNNSKNILFHIIFEVLFSLSFSVVFTIEMLGIFKCKFNEFPAIDILLILLPTIITVISISLSLTNEKILNLKRREFYKLLNGWHYNFLSMILIVIAIFILYTICRMTGARISVVVLEGIAIFYSIYFSCTEIPVLSQNSKKIIKIIRSSYYKNTFIDYEFSRFEKQGILSIAIKQLVFENGIKCTYFALKNKNHDPILLNYLLSLQNNLLFDAVEDSPLFKENLVNEYKGLDLDLVTIIDTCFSDLEDLLSFSTDFNIEEIYSSENNVYLMTRCLFCLHKICQTFELKKKEISKLNSIIYRLCTITDKNEGRNRWRSSFINSMIASTVPCNDFWFAEALRNYDFPRFIFSCDGNFSGFFYLIYCFYISQISKFISPETKADVNKFCSKPSNGLNSDGSSWKQYARNEIERCNDECIIKIIVPLLKIYNSSQDSIFYIYKKGANFVGSNVEDNFDKRFLLDVWLEMILFGSFVRPSSEILEDVINTFSEDDKKDLVYVLSHKWLENDQLKQKEEIGFLSFIGLKAETSINYSNKDAIECLAKFRKKYIQEREEKRIKEEMPKDLGQYKELIKKYFNEGRNNNPIIDKSLDVSLEKKMYISLRVHSEGLDSILEQYKSRLKDFFDKEVRQKIIKEIEPFFYNGDYSFDELVVKKILSFKPDYMTANTWNFHGSDKDVSKIEMITNSYLPRYLFWKKEGIVANFEYCDEDSEFRQLNDTEINRIIDEEYTLVNGLYKYGRYGKSDANSILVSREELFGYLKNTQFISLIVFKSKIVLDPSKILFLKH